MKLNLFEISYEGATLYLNSTNRDLSIGGNTYYGSATEISDINYSLTETMGEIDIRIPFNKASTPLKKYVTEYLGSGVIELVAKEYDIDLATSVTIFTGVVDVIGLTDMYVGIKFKSYIEFMSNSGTRLVATPSCVTWIYSERCAMDKDNYKVTGTLDTVNGITLTDTVFDTKDDGWFIWGYIECENEVRLITGHVGANITLISPFSGAVAAGKSYIAYAGCDKRVTTCKTKFNNIANFLGFPYVPLEESVYIGQKGSSTGGGGSS